MIGRRAVVGLSLLSALLFCAFAAQSASAAQAVNTTTFTCFDTGNFKTGDFTDAHCDVPGTPGSQQFAHKTIPTFTQTEVTMTNEKVTNGTKDSEPTVVKSKIGLSSVEITCTTVKGEPKNSAVENVEEGKGHFWRGVWAWVTEACTVNKPAKCAVKAPIKSDSTLVAVEKLGAAENEMGVELKGSGAEETLAEVTFEGAECALKSKTFKIKGSLIGTSGPTTESSQTSKGSGATVVVTPKNGMQKTKLGVENAEISTILTRTANGIPLSATTPT